MLSRKAENWHNKNAVMQEQFEFLRKHSKKLKNKKILFRVQYNYSKQIRKFIYFSNLQEANKFLNKPFFNFYYDWNSNLYSENYLSCRIQKIGSRGGWKNL